MKILKVTKLLSVALLSMGLASCYVSGVEESSIALAKWHGEKVNDFFFAYGKGEFQAQNSAGKKAYSWRSPTRNVETRGESYVVKVAHKYIPGKYVDKVVYAPSTFKAYQCVLRIETTSSGRITELQNLKNTSECARYFSLSEAEIKAILAARK